MLTQERLKELFYCDVTTGIFTRKIKGHGIRYNSLGSVGTVRHDGYHEIMINYEKYLRSHLVWLYVYGNLPVKQIDHIDRHRDNDSINNLREVSALENRHNMSKKACNTSGHTGVYRDKINSKWYAQIRVNYKAIHLGRFDLLEDAITARQKAIKKYNFHPTHGQTTL